MNGRQAKGCWKRKLQSLSGDISTYFINSMGESCETNHSSNQIWSVSTFTVITLLLSLRVGLNVRGI